MSTTAAPMDLPAHRPRTTASLYRKAMLKCWFQTLVLDHGVLRLLHRNWHRVGQQAFRSNHPLPHQVATAARVGVRTVICFRRFERALGPCLLTERACRRHGLIYIETGLTSRAAPKKEALYRVEAALASAEYPVLMHCKSGADRAGLGSALYLLLRENRPVEEAQEQLRFFPYGHLRQAKAGVLDYFLARYAAHHRVHGTAFMDWVREVYDPQELQRSFRAQWWATQFDRWVLRRE